MNQVRAIANETMNFDGNAEHGSIDSIFHYMDRAEGDEIEINENGDDEDPFGTAALTTEHLANTREAPRVNSPQAAQMEEKHLEIQTPRGVGEDDYNEEDFELDEEKTTS